MKKTLKISKQNFNKDFDKTLMKTLIKKHENSLGFKKLISLLNPQNSPINDCIGLLNFLKNVWDRYDSGYNLLSFLYYRDSLVIWCLSFHFPLQAKFYLYIKKNFPPSYWFSCLQLSFLCTQKTVTKRSSYSECVKMCLKKQRRIKKKKLQYTRNYNNLRLENLNL